ncbi:UNVERIFIED_CONTAM: Retrovirus-related Pol polyprotein from type-2 retrotransposable element R2DM [Sesamum latifolium]|uniref:Retrovirus-related Pol polyprotein from type-2 retrotransposable element R2DM n=1 Tax=Sesamum latifolium TaxID=2727402 RepID=A0AAW2VG32_9LAMI
MDAFSVSLDGSIHSFFASARGLRQGDPLSPYLFVPIMQTLYMLLQQAVEHNGLFSYHWKYQDLGIVNIYFVDDLLLFCKWDMDSTVIIKTVLETFSQLSGLQANPTKSQVIFFKAAAQNKQTILAVSGFQEGSLPIKYLRLSLIVSRLKITDCQPALA